MKKLNWILFTVAALMASASSYAFEGGDFVLRSRGLYINPAVSTDTLTLDVKTQQVPEFDLSYFFTQDLSLELIAATTRHDIYLAGSHLGKVTLLPPTLSAQYHLNALERIKPYAGVGLNFTWFYSVDLPTGVDISRTSFGPSFQLGSDFMISDRAFVNVDIKKILVSTDVNVGGVKADTLHINPWIYAVGLGFRL